MSREESFLVPLKYIDITRTTDASCRGRTMTIGTWMERKELSYAWIGFTIFTILKKKPPDWFTWSGRRLTRKHCRLGLFQDCWFYQRPWEFKVKIGRGLVYFCKSHVCSNKLDVQETHTSVSHSSTEAEIIWTAFPFSLSGFIPYRIRLDNPRKSFGETRCRPQSQTCKNPSNSSTPTSFQWTLTIQCCCMKMIVKGRSPTMRHMSKTHRNALVWLFDRINLDPNIQIRYIDTKYHLADMLTEWNFTRDDWNNLFHLFNMNHFSSTHCTKIFCGGRGRRRCPHSRW